MFVTVQASRSSVERGASLSPSCAAAAAAAADWRGKGCRASAEAIIKFASPPSLLASLSLYSSSMCGGGWWRAVWVGRWAVVVVGGDL